MSTVGAFFSKGLVRIFFRAIVPRWVMHIAAAAPSVALQGESGGGNQLFHLAAAGFAGADWRITEFLSDLKVFVALCTFIFINRHGLTSPDKFCSLM